MTISRKSILKTPRARNGALVLAVAAAVGVGIWMLPATADVQQTSEAVDMAFASEPPNDEERSQLRDDLKGARGLEGEERRDALKGIREDARDGEYGDGIEQRIERRGNRRAAFFALLPDEMQTDLKAAKGTDDLEKRRAMLKDIREKAADGGYGAKVQEAFELLAKNRRGHERG